jgi:hypothetical protein
LSLEVLVEHMIWIAPVFQDSHDSVTQVPIILIFVLLLSSKKHISHCVVHVFLKQVLNLEKHCNDLRLLQSAVDFLLLCFYTIVDHVSLL